MDSVSEIKPAPGDAFDAARAALPRARHVPGDYYSSPELFEREMRRCFRRGWLLAARAEEIEKPGDYMALRLAGQPVLLCRDEAGSLHAFYNMCVHRGAAIAAGQGNARLFQCPYHGWSYDLTGRLTGAAHMAGSEGFDLADCRLRRLGLALWGGNIFISFDPEPTALADGLPAFAPEFEVFRMQDCRTANKITLELDCNWKLANENLMDFYHVSVLHAKTFGNKVAWDTAAMTLSPDGGYHMWYQAKPSTPGGKLILGKLPCLADKPDGFACVGFLPPNLTIFARFDCVRLLVVWPRDVGRCQLVVYHLFPTEFFAKPEFEAACALYRDYQIEVLEEDRSMIQSLQEAMASEAFVPGRMSVAEKPIHNYINGHLARMFD
jgi:Rieske 2Fe-2S family protein